LKTELQWCPVLDIAISTNFTCLSLYYLWHRPHWIDLLGSVVWPRLYLPVADLPVGRTGSTQILQEIKY
jgi:hypothetical protein